MCNISGHAIVRLVVFESARPTPCVRTETNNKALSYEHMENV